jgi:Zn-dependent protease with chaperone function
MTLAAELWGWSGTLALELGVLAALAWIAERPSAGRSRRLWPELRAGLWAAVLLRPFVPVGALGAIAPWSPVPGWLSWPSALGALAALPGGGAGVALGPITLGPLGPLGPATLGPAGFGAAAASPWPAAAALLWASGALALGAVTVLRERRAERRWLAGARPAAADVRALAVEAARALGLERVPRIAIAPDGRGPALVGLARPVVVLPAGLAAPAHVRHALLHELAHVARRDPWRAALAQAAALAVWWHPAAWLARRRLAALREIACDAHAARALRGDAAGYRGTLLELARPLAGPAPGMRLAGGGDGVLLERLRRLERPAPARLRAAAAPAVAVLALLACLDGPPASGLPEPPERRARAAVLPPLDELEGCLQLRYAVFGLAGGFPAAGAGSPTPAPSR